MHTCILSPGPPTSGLCLAQAARVGQTQHRAPSTPRGPGPGSFPGLRPQGSLCPLSIVGPRPTAPASGPRALSGARRTEA